MPETVTELAQELAARTTDCPVPLMAMDFAYPAGGTYATQHQKDCSGGCKGTGQVPLLDVRDECPCLQQSLAISNLSGFFRAGGCVACWRNERHDEDCGTCGGLGYTVTQDLERWLEAAWPYSAHGCVITFLKGVVGGYAVDLIDSQNLEWRATPLEALLLALKEAMG